MTGVAYSRLHSFNISFTSHGPLWRFQRHPIKQILRTGWMVQKLMVEVQRLALHCNDKLWFPGRGLFHTLLLLSSKGNQHQRCEFWTLYTSHTIPAAGCIKKNNPVMKTTAKRKVTWRSYLFFLYLALLMEVMLFQIMIPAERTSKLV